MPVPPRIRVVVQLPYNRPEEPHPEPPHIEWNAEKANILWEVIALSRSSDNGGTDWKGLAAHLEVPLPYLLYRAQARYEEDLRGLQDIRGVQSTTAPFPATPSTPAIPTPHPVDAAPSTPSPHPLSIKIPPAKLSNITALGARRLSASQRTPLGVRARLNSLTHKSPSKARGGLGHATYHKASSSTATLQSLKRTAGPLSVPPRTVSPFSDDAESESSDEEELEQRKEEEMERQVEEQEQLDKRIAQLQRMMTSERLGLVKSPVSQEKGKGREDARREEIVRGRPPFPASAVAVPANPNGTAPGSPSKLRFTEHVGVDGRLVESTSGARGRDHSASVSSASSPQGSIPSISSSRIPSPSSPPLHAHTPSSHDRSRIPIQQRTQATSRLHPHDSPMHRHLSPSKSSSPPAVSVRNATVHRHARQGFGALGAAGVSEGESNHGSSASSFSDLSDASLSPSSLESALMSNIRGTGSRLSGITRSRPGGRGGVRQQTAVESAGAGHVS